jgi:hypothetical protein
MEESILEDVDMVLNDIKKKITTYNSDEDLPIQFPYAKLTESCILRLMGLKDFATITTTTMTKDESTRKQLRPVCKWLKIINRYYSLHMCKDCCSESPIDCKLTDHKCSKKVGAVKPYEQTSLAKANLSSSAVIPPTNPTILNGVLKVIQNTICDKCFVYILYIGGTKGDQL